MSGTSFRGISAAQDPRFKDKTALGLKALQSSGKLPAHYSTRVDIRKVAIPVMRSWIDKRVEELLGFEDDVVSEYAVGLLEAEGEYYPDPKALQLSLTGFLSSSAPIFVSELWSLLISAQNSVGGIPQEFVEAKKKEMAEARAKDKGAIQGSQRYAGGQSNGAERRHGTGANTAPVSRTSRWGPEEISADRHPTRRSSPPPSGPGSMMYPRELRGDDRRYNGSRGGRGGSTNDRGPNRRDWARDRERDDGPPPRWGAYAAGSADGSRRRSEERDEDSRRREEDRKRGDRRGSPEYRDRARSRHDEPSSSSSRRIHRDAPRERSVTPPYRERRRRTDGRDRSLTPPYRSAARSPRRSPISPPRERLERSHKDASRRVERSVSPLSAKSSPRSSLSPPRHKGRRAERSRSRSPVPRAPKSKWDQD